MIDSVQIKNFRCFEDHFIEGFGTVNVVVGDNGSGKTSLLEGIFLAQVGHPEIITRFRVWRGLGAVLALARNRGSYEALWKDLFFNGLQERTIEIATTGTPANARSLTIRYNPDEPITMSSPLTLVGGQSSDSSTIMPLVFSSKAQDDSDPRVFKPLITAEGLNWGGLAPPSLVALFTPAFAAAVSPTETATQFSNLSKERQESRILKAISRVYPDVKGLGIESEMGLPMLFADIKSLSIKMPVGLISAGTHKLISILLAISAHPNGMVLIDEIENGFYYRTMPKVWETLVSFAKEYRVQIIASTHSRECLEAAHSALTKNKRLFWANPDGE